MASDRIKVGIVGATGYIGSELMRFLSVHPRVEIAWVTSESSSGRKVHEMFPNLLGYVRDEFRAFDPELLGGIDLAFFCLPHTGAMEVMKTVVSDFPGLRVIDCSGDFRSPVIDKWEQYYGTRHLAPELQERFVYGIPEFHREAIRGAQYVANPGCFATALNLLLAPFAREGQLFGEVCVSGITGSSGSGNKPGSGTHHPERGQNLRAYKVLKHQHLVEVVPFLESLHEENDFDLFFVPHSGPFVRGIFATAFLPLDENVTLASVDALLRSVYEGEPFVQIVPDTPDMRLVQNTNRAMLSYRAQGDMMVGMCAIDNLVKGGSGQAVQNMNLMFGFEETQGLHHPAGFV